MKKVIFIGSLIFYIIIGLSAAFGETFTLKDLFLLSLEKAERIKVAQENVLLAKIGQEKALAPLLPKVAAFSTYTEYTQNKRSDTGSLIQPDTAASWGLRIDESLSLIGREFIAWESSKEGVEKSKYDLRSYQDDYLIQVATLFYEVLKAKRAVDIAKANTERLTRYREAAQKKLQVGEATKTALLRAEGELSGALAEKVRAENTLKSQQILLGRLVGLEGPFDIEEESPRDAPRSLEELKRLASQSRPELTALKIQKEIAKKQVAFAKGALWPNVSLSAVYARADQYPPPSNLNRESIYATVALNFPFYEGGLRKAEVREAEIKLKQVEITEVDTIKNINAEIEKAYLDYLTQEGMIKYLKDQLTFARENYYAVAKQYEYGLASSLDVLDANNLLLNTEKQLMETIYNTELAKVKLKRLSQGLTTELLADSK